MDGHCPNSSNISNLNNSYVDHLDSAVFDCTLSFGRHIPLGTGANAGMAKVIIDGWANSSGAFGSFESGWFAYNGSPCGIEVKSLLWATTRRDSNISTISPCPA
ncbi:MAG: hypothetical protein WEC36_06365 [Phycisphaeraceae bacterium]